jgi:hypothetical protein
MILNTHMYLFTILIVFEDNCQLKKPHVLHNTILSIQVIDIVMIFIFLQSIPFDAFRMCTLYIVRYLWLIFFFLFIPFNKKNLYPSWICCCSYQKYWLSRFWNLLKLLSWQVKLTRLFILHKVALEILRW